MPPQRYCQALREGFKKKQKYVDKSTFGWVGVSGWGQNPQKTFLSFLRGGGSGLVIKHWNQIFCDIPPNIKLTYDDRRMHMVIIASWLA